jgi:uncharacterized protein YegJ (DUF2314 family)
MLTTRIAALSVLLGAISISSGLQAAVSAGPAPASEVETLLKHSRDKRNSKQARQYEDQFLKAIEPVLLPAMRICTKKTSDTTEPGAIAFVIGADGHVKRLLWSKNIPMAECVGEKLRSITRLPRPPQDNWVDGVGVANHSQAEKNAPVDKPFQATSEQFVEYNKAIAPYVAKARATYPAAKARFLAGLPPGYSFSVRVRLKDSNGRREDSFLTVNKISGEKITGRLGTVTLLRNYKTGQTISVKESEIDNWVIVRPDGTEEGNYVGKFLDHYKPR